MQLISQFNKGFSFLLSIIDIYSKYVWAIPLKDEKGIIITNGFPKILKESNRKTEKVWVDKSREFYNRSMKSWLEKNGIEICSTHNEAKYFLAERFIRTLKNKIYKYMTPVSKNVYINKWDDIINKSNNTYHSTIKTKPVDVKPKTCIESSKEIINKDPKFKIGDTVGIQNKIFTKAYTPNWSEEVLVITKVKNTVSWTYIISDLNGEEIVGTFYKREL